MTLDEALIRRIRRAIVPHGWRIRVWAELSTLRGAFRRPSRTSRLR